MVVPTHVAIIMDGNGRWARQRGHPRLYGHIRGSAQVRPIVRECGRLGVKFLTLYAFSSENWGRPTAEVGVLMRLLEKYLIRELKTLMTNNVRLRAIGDLSQLPEGPRKILVDTIEKTKNNTGLTLTFALSYGSRQEILGAVRVLAEKVRTGAVDPATLTARELESNLQTAFMPDPDLIIRTSGENRLSNFLLWQAAYSELYFTQSYWPDFSIPELHRAFEDFSSRQRRYGLTETQTPEHADIHAAEKAHGVLAMTKVTRIRAMSALVAMVSVVLIIKFSGYAGIAVTCFFASLVGLSEFGRMALFGERYKIARRYFIGLGLIDFTVSIYRNDLLLHSFILSTLFIFIMFLLMARDDSIPLEELVNKAGLSLFGILYAGVCPVYISLLTRLSDHLEWFIFTLVVVFAGDTTAYFVGRRFGKSRLFTRISPKKSLEGAMGSLFASVVAGLTVRNFLLPDTDLFLMLSLCILTSIVAQLGDLSESLIKRSFATKDSGHLMPGHGGLLDRLDGILFGAPLVFIYVKYVVLS